MVFPRDALAGLFGGPVVFTLNTSRSSRDCVLVAMEPFDPLFGVVLFPDQKFLLLRRQISTAELILTDPGETSSRVSRYRLRTL